MFINYHQTLIIESISTVARFFVDAIFLSFLRILHVYKSNFWLYFYQSWHYFPPMLFSWFAAFFCTTGRGASAGSGRCPPILENFARAFLEVEERSCAIVAERFEPPSPFRVSRGHLTLSLAPLARLHLRHNGCQLLASQKSMPSTQGGMIWSVTSASAIRPLR